MLNGTVRGMKEQNVTMRNARFFGYAYFYRYAFGYYFTFRQKLQRPALFRATVS